MKFATITRFLILYKYNNVLYNTNNNNTVINLAINEIVKELNYKVSDRISVIYVC